MEKNQLGAFEQKMFMKLNETACGLTVLSFVIVSFNPHKQISLG